MPTYGWHLCTTVGACLLVSLILPPKISSSFSTCVQWCAQYYLPSTLSRCSVSDIPDIALCFSCRQVQHYDIYEYKRSSQL